MAVRFDRGRPFRFRHPVYCGLYRAECRMNRDRFASPDLARRAQQAAVGAAHEAVAAVEHGQWVELLEVIHQAQQTGVPLFVQTLAGALQALLQLVELFPLPGEVFGGMDEPVGESVKALLQVSQAALAGALQAMLLLCQLAQDERLLGDGQLGCSGGGGGALVGNEIGDGEVGFVSDAADDR